MHTIHNIYHIYLSVSFSHLFTHVYIIITKSIDIYYIVNARCVLAVVLFLCFFDDVSLEGWRLKTKTRYTTPNVSFSHFTDEICLKTARRIVPLQAFAVAVPQFHAVLLLAVLVPEVVGLAGVPVGERDRSAVGHPEEVALVGQIGARRPKVFVAQT